MCGDLSATVISNISHACVDSRGVAGGQQHTVTYLTSSTFSHSSLCVFRQRRCLNLEPVLRRDVCGHPTVSAPVKLLSTHR